MITLIFIHFQREKVDQLLHESSTSHAIVCDNLQKIYPGRDGNPEKFAVRGLYLAVPPGECFGMLGPNGAGKTSFISMVSIQGSLSLQMTYKVLGICIRVFLLMGSDGKCFQRGFFGSVYLLASYPGII